MRFVFDLDGTLSFDGKTIAPEITQALLEADSYGHQMTFVSARAYRDCLPILGEKLAQETVVSLDGSLVHYQGNLVFQRCIDDKGFKEILSWCQQYNLPYFIEADFNYCSHLMEKIPFDRQVDPQHLGHQISLEELTNPSKIIVEMSNHEDLVLDMLADLKQLGQVDIAYDSLEKYFLIRPTDTDRASSLEEVHGNDFVVFGDSRNDKAMFKASLYCIQVGDYQPLQEFSDEIIPRDSSAISQKIKELYSKF